jgi:hypothetical protein
MGGKLVEEELVDFSLILYSFNKNMLCKDKVKFIRDFFGYKISKNNKKYAYNGLLSKFKGIKISNSSFLIPHKNYSVVKAYLESRDIDFVVKK